MTELTLQGYEVACIAYGEVDATIDFLLKADAPDHVWDYVLFDNDNDLIMKGREVLGIKKESPAEIQQQRSLHEPQIEEHARIHPVTGLPAYGLSDVAQTYPLSYTQHAPHTRAGRKERAAYARQVGQQRPVGEGYNVGGMNVGRGMRERLKDWFIGRPKQALGWAAGKHADYREGVNEQRQKRLIEQLRRTGMSSDDLPEIGSGAPAAAAPPAPAVRIAPTTGAAPTTDDEVDDGELEDAARGLQETSSTGTHPPELTPEIPPMPEAEAQWLHEPHFEGIVGDHYKPGQGAWKKAMEAIRGAGLGPESPEGVEDYESAMEYLEPILGVRGARRALTEALVGGWGHEQSPDEQSGPVIRVDRPEEIPPMPSGPVKTSSDNPLDMAWSHLTILKRRE